MFVEDPYNIACCSVCPMLFGTLSSVSMVQDHLQQCGMEGGKAPAPSHAVKLHQQKAHWQAVRCWTYHYNPADWESLKTAPLRAWPPLGGSP